MACEGGGGCDRSRSIGETGGWCATGLECASVRIFFNTNFANFANFVYLAKGSVLRAEFLNANFANFANLAKGSALCAEF